MPASNKRSVKEIKSSVLHKKKSRKQDNDSEEAAAKTTTLHEEEEDVSLDELYRYLVNESGNYHHDGHRKRRINWQQILVTRVWPALLQQQQQSSSSSFTTTTTTTTITNLTKDQLSLFMAAILSHEYGGEINSIISNGSSRIDGSILDFIWIDDTHTDQQPEMDQPTSYSSLSLSTFATWCKSVFHGENIMNTTKNNHNYHTIMTITIHCLDICWMCLASAASSSSSSEPNNDSSITTTPRIQQQQLLYQILLQQVIRVDDLYQSMPKRYLEWYQRSRKQTNNWIHNTTTTTTPSSKDTSFVVTIIQQVLQIMEGDELLLFPKHPQPEGTTIPESTFTTNSIIISNGGNDRDDDMDKDENNIDMRNNGSDDLEDSENEENLDGEYDEEAGEEYDKAEQQEDMDTNLPGKNPQGPDEQENQQQEQQREQAWNLIHRALELLCDLLTSVRVREHLVPYLVSIHWSIRTRHAMGTSTFSKAHPHMLLTQQLLERTNQWIHGFPPPSSIPAPDTTSSPLVSFSEWRTIYHRRAGIFQKMCHRYYSAHLPDVIYASVGLLCTPPTNHQTSYLRQSLGGLSDAEFAELLHRMRLIDAHAESRPETYDRNFLLAILEEYLVIPSDPLQELQSSPLYPTEQLLWDFSKIPPGHASLLSSAVLSVPKLLTQFLSFPDYLGRNFELVRLESAYEIRSDLTDVIRRVRPVLRQKVLEGHEDEFYGTSEDAGTILQTEFAGWARMALELQGKLQIIRVHKPLLGHKYPSQVIAEITVDLDPCGAAIRREWDELGEYDNLFLVGIDASRMSGKQVPLLREYLRHQSVGTGGANSSAEQRVHDEDDRTFPERFGVVLVRGCMILQVRDEAGNDISDPSNEGKPSGTKRIYRVALDPMQFSMDLNSPSGTDIYKTLNLVVRRHGKANNFRSVLETIRSLMAGMGSINRVIPTWMQSVLLGQGDPTNASYQSETLKAYAQNTAGVANPDAFLDYGDTFLDEEHLRSSFAELSSEIIVNGRKDFESGAAGGRCNYRIRIIENVEGKSKVVAESYEFTEGRCGNPVRFTPIQVKAIRSGLSPGLSLVVGPPGTGKTDVAVQIIACLYHSFPTQRTIIITHSNAALNDIFQKVMARGDIEERYLVRLGAGERGLQTESTHDFTKIGRVEYSLARRGILLEQVQQLSESLGISGRAERGADGSAAYTCDTAAYFHRHQVQKRIRKFDEEIKKASISTDDADVTDLFPFVAFFKLEKCVVSFGKAKKLLSDLQNIFNELAEYRPLELLRTQRQRGDYLLMKQARVVAMTCTHAAIARSHLIELGFEYDNIVVEEAGQMLEIESFIPMLLQRGQADGSNSARLKRCLLMGDHNQLPPIIQNMTLARYSNLDQSMFARLIRMGVPYIQLDKQGRSRPEIANLFSWRYHNLGNLEHVVSSEAYNLANPGFAHTFQVIDVGDYEGRGETCPSAYFYQNKGEGEYVVALFQYMVMIGYSPNQISILTTYNGQKALIQDILSQRCGVGSPLEGLLPRVVATVDEYQGQQNDIVLLSLVRTEFIGHLKDVRRLVVAVSRARLGLYIFCRYELFSGCYELQPTWKHFTDRPTKLQLVMGENNPTERKVSDEIPSDQLFEVEDVVHMGQIAYHAMQQLYEDASPEES